ncbi:RNA-directed DNA polymerase, eukaryota [Tanacetum coccineum]
MNGEDSKLNNDGDASDSEVVSDTYFGDNADEHGYENEQGPTIKMQGGFTPDKSTNVINEKEVSDAAEVRSNSKSDGGNSRILEEVENIDGCFSSEGRNIGVKPKEGGSILEILDEMIKVGQTMGFSMEGCTKDMENIIGSKGVEALGNSGGILCTWDSSIFHKEHHIISDNFVALYGTWIPNQLKLLVISVYAPRSLSLLSQILWGYISSLNIFGQKKAAIGLKRRFVGVGVWTTKVQQCVAVNDLKAKIRVEWFFEHGSFAIGCNASFVALIPKILDPKIVSDYRPISLVGSLYKDITKILATRLSSVISSLISDVQSAFLPNRQILDGPFILSELLSWCKFKYNQAIVFKVDFAKAYDSIRWDIGDPLAPFLFILIMESLHLYFSRAVEAGIFTGIKIGSSLTISHLFYADDAVFIGEWSHNNLKGLGNESIVKPKGGSLSGTKTLSIGGCLTLLKSELGSTPIYNMSLFKVPKSMLHSMESLRRNFFKVLSASFSSLWKSILNEVKSLKAQGVDLISHYKFRVPITCSFRRPVRGGLEAQQLEHLICALLIDYNINSEDRWVWGNLEMEMVFFVSKMFGNLDLTRPFFLKRLASGIQQLRLVLILKQCYTVFFTSHLLEFREFS